MDFNCENETEAEIMALRRALRRARSSRRQARSFVVESSDSESEGRLQAQCPSQATCEGSRWFAQPAAEPPSHSVPTKVAPAAPYGDDMMPTPLASLPATSYLPELVREFGQIRTKLQSPRHPSEPQHLQDQRRIFREWMQKDFSASFSLKALQDAERALTELYQAQQMTKGQYESFTSFFENLRALRDEHLKAERQANRMRCYNEKHTRTSATLQQLVEDCSTMKDRIIVVVAEIQKLEKQLYDLKVEQTTLSSKLYKNIEEVKKVNHKVEESEAQLANINTALEEPDRIFTIMQTYHSRIAALAKDVNLLI